MKISFWKRALFFLHWLFALFAGLIAVLKIVWPGVFAEAYEWTCDLIGEGRLRIIGWAAAGIFAALSVFTVCQICSSSGKDKDKGFIVVDNSENGKTRIAVGAVDQMIRQAVRGVEGIAEMRSFILNHEDSISVKMTVTLLDGAHIPTVTQNVKRSVKGYIELNCGVAVRDISVSVHSVESSDNAGKNVLKRGMRISAYSGETEKQTAVVKQDTEANERDLSVPDSPEDVLQEPIRLTLGSEEAEDETVQETSEIENREE